MKTLSLLFLLVMLCSFSRINVNNSLAEYDLKGKIKSVTYFIFSDSTMKTIGDKSITQYDKWGNEIAYNVYLQNGDIDSAFITTRRYKYNSNNLRIERIDGSDSLLSWKTTYTYDKNNRLIETNRYHETGVLEQRCTYQYDPSGNEIKERSYDGKGAPEYNTIFEYKDGDLISQVEHWNYPPSLFFSAKTIVKYDKQGTIERIGYNLKNDIITDIKISNRHYDSKGNLIKWTETVYDKGRRYKNFCIREISYY